MSIRTRTLLGACLGAQGHRRRGPRRCRHCCKIAASLRLPLHPHTRFSQSHITAAVMTGYLAASTSSGGHHQSHHAITLDLHTVSLPVRVSATKRGDPSRGDSATRRARSGLSPRTLSSAALSCSSRGPDIARLPPQQFVTAPATAAARRRQEHRATVGPPQCDCAVGGRHRILAERSSERCMHAENSGRRSLLRPILAGIP